jgi:hypothetical protein
MKCSRLLYPPTLLAIALSSPAWADKQIYTSVCNDPAGGQSFFIEEMIDGGRHTQLKVAKIDLLPGDGIARVLVFTAVPGGIDEGDTYATSDLTLSFASDADQYQLIAKANISIATEGETGPIIEGFRLEHDNGDILQVIDESAPLPCKGGDLKRAEIGAGESEPSRGGLPGAEERKAAAHKDLVHAVERAAPAEGVTPAGSKVPEAQ